MKIQVLKSKLKEVIVTGASLDYEGSITIDKSLMIAANLSPFERVEVNGKTSPARIVTYVIPGEPGSGCIEMNGGAALHFKKGDHIHVLSYAEIEERFVFGHKPIIVTTNEKNRPIIESEQ